MNVYPWEATVRGSCHIGLEGWHFLDKRGPQVFNHVERLNRKECSPMKVLNTFQDESDEVKVMAARMRVKLGRKETWLQRLRNLSNDRTTTERKLLNAPDWMGTPGATTRLS